MDGSRESTSSVGTHRRDVLTQDLLRLMWRAELDGLTERDIEQASDEALGGFLNSWLGEAQS
jgi:hypothetical protein